MQTTYNTPETQRPIQQLPQLLCGSLLFLYALFFLVRAFTSLTFPYSLEYGEGPVFYEAGQLVRHGFNPASLYTPNDVVPYQAAVYSPLYYYLTALGMLFLGTASIAAARLVSLTACLWIGITLYRALPAPIRRDKPQARRIFALAVAVTPFATEIIYGWGVLAKTDMLAVAFSLAAVAHAWKAAPTKSTYIVAGLLCGLALLTKQSAVAAPAAIFCWLIWQRRWQGLLIFVLSVLALLTPLILVFQLATNGAFLRHMLTYNGQPLKFSILADRLGYLLTTYPLLVGLSILLVIKPLVSGVALWRIYFVSAFLVSFSTAKAGSFNNYFIETLCIASLLSWWVISWLWYNSRYRQFGRIKFRLSAIILLLMVLQLVKLLHIPFVADGYFTRDYARAEQIATYIQDISKQGPLFAEDSAWQAALGLPVELDDPFVFGQLSEQGVWNDQPFLSRLKAGYYRNVFFEICKLDNREQILDELVATNNAEPFEERLAPEVLQVFKDRSRFVPTKRIGCMVFLRAV